MSERARPPAGDELAHARTQPPPSPGFANTLPPLPADLDRTLTPSEEAAASQRFASTMRGDDDDDDDDDRLLPAPQADDPRVKDLIKARLFRGKARPVKLGRFTVLDRIGEGGMGVVYAAYDDQLDRKVAVKLLRGEATRNDEHGRTRLLREAQAMARLSHPNIVTVHEVSELDDHQVFIAMEFIRGETLDSWLRREARPWRAVLDTFIKAGRGLEAAHRAGLVHRDFKPHNVLVGEHDAVKVLDFGLARSAEHAGTEELAVTPESGASDRLGSLLDTPLTRTGAIMGTPAYMAPEQHEGRPATAHSDQFSFCVSLYEGLYGLHPFNCTNLGTLLATVLGGHVRDPSTTSKVPAWLRRVLLRGLTVDPQRRYPSMSDLLAELGKDPAVARRRWLTTAALAGLVGGASFGAAALLPAATPVCQGVDAELAGVWDPARGEAVQRALLATGVAYAGDTWAHLQPRLDAYAAQWTAMRAEACETHHAARQSDQLFDLRTACLDQRRASLAALVDTLGEADAAVVEKAVLAASALPPISGCGDSEALTQSVRPPEEPGARAQVQSHREALARAQSIEQAGQYERSLALVRPVVAAAEQLGYSPLLAEALLRQGSVQMAASAHSDADASFARAMWTAIAADHDTVAALAGSRRLFLRAARMQRTSDATADIPLVEALSRRVERDGRIQAEYLNNLGVTYLYASDLGRAGEALGASLRLKQQILASDDPEIAYTLGNLANLAIFSGDYGEAIRRSLQAVEIAERAFGPEHPQTAAFQQNLGVSYRFEGRLHAAQEQLSRVLAIQTRVLGPQALERRLVLQTLGEIELTRRDYPRARQYLQQSLDLHAAISPGLDVGAVGLLQDLGDVALAAGDLDEFRAHHAQALQLQAAEYGAASLSTSQVALHYGTSLLRAGLLAEARTPLSAALAAREASEAPGSPLLAAALEQVGMLELREGQLQTAEATLRRALAIHEGALPASSPALATNLLHLGEALLAQERRADAVAPLRRAVDIFAGARERDDHDLALARFALARALAGADASALASQALAVLRAKGPGFASEADAIDAWLARHGAAR